jgi:hypothetical protein
MARAYRNRATGNYHLSLYVVPSALEELGGAKPKHVKTWKGKSDAEVWATARGNPPGSAWSQTALGLLAKVATAEWDFEYPYT